MLHGSGVAFFQTSCSPCIMIAKNDSLGHCDLCNMLHKSDCFLSKVACNQLTSHTPFRWLKHAYCKLEAIL